MRIPLLSLLIACNDDFQSPARPDAEPPASDTAAVSVPDDPRAAAILALDGDATTGQATFQDRCSGCHDVAGLTAQAGPALAPWVAAQTPASTLGVMLAGRGAMPAQELSDADAADIIAWMYRSWAVDPDEPGAVLFHENCFACHSTDGTRKFTLSISALVPAHYDRSLTQVITSGTNGGMPSFRDRLSTEEIATIVDWLLATF